MECNRLQHTGDDEFNAHRADFAASIKAAGTACKSMLERCAKIIDAGLKGVLDDSVVEKR